LFLVLRAGPAAQSTLLLYVMFIGASIAAMRLPREFRSISRFLLGRLKPPLTTSSSSLLNYDRQIERAWRFQGAAASAPTLQNPEVRKVNES